MAHIENIIHKHKCIIFNTKNTNSSSALQFNAIGAIDDVIPLMGKFDYHYSDAPMAEMKKKWNTFHNVRNINLT